VVLTYKLRPLCLNKYETPNPKRINEKHTQTPKQAKTEADRLPFLLFGKTAYIAGGAGRVKLRGETAGKQAHKKGAFYKKTAENARCHGPVH
jgi:hypothetical protein